VGEGRVGGFVTGYGTDMVGGPKAQL